MDLQRESPRPEPDEALIRRLRERDPEAFRWLSGRYGGPLFTYLARRLQDRAAAEDLVAEVFLRVLRHIDRYQDRGRFSAWLFTIAYRLCLDHRARHRAPEEPEAAGPEPASPEPGPERGAASAQARERIERALAALPAEQREVFLLREYGGLTFAEIADALDCPVSTALARMRYAVLKLRKDLEGFDV